MSSEETQQPPQPPEEGGTPQATKSTDIESEEADKPAKEAGDEDPAGGEDEQTGEPEDPVMYVDDDDHPEPNNEGHAPTQIELDQEEQDPETGWENPPKKKRVVWLCHSA